MTVTHDGRVPWIRFALSLALLSVACGTDAGDPAGAIQNADTLATSTTHWSCVSTNGGTSVEIGGDGQAKTILSNTGSGLQNTTWSKLSASAVLFGPAPGPTAVVGQLRDIAGSLSSGSFSATVVASNGVQGVCAFSLVSGTL